MGSTQSTWGLISRVSSRTYRLVTKPVIMTNPFDVSIGKPSWQPSVTAAKPHPFGEGQMPYQYEMYPRKGMGFGTLMSDMWNWSRNSQSIRGRTLGNLALVVTIPLGMMVYNISKGLPDDHEKHHKEAHRRAIINAPKLW